LFATKELAAVGKPGLLYGGGFHQLGVQAMGVAVCGLFAFVVSFTILYVMKKVMNGLRVTEEEEIIGLDVSEHGSYGYPEAFMKEEQKEEQSRLAN
jgi:Amt family ammonium transporter